MRKRPEAACAPSGIVFDYWEAAKAAKISATTLHALEREARAEFPDDSMLTELHVLRAIKAYAGKGRRGGKA
jgi:hypothetical protein